MHIRGDKDVRFEAVGKVIAVCQQVGILKVGFLTQPPPHMQELRHAVSSLF